jgi:hypothetical protein
VAYLQARLQVLLDIGVADTATERFWLTDPLADKVPEESRGRTLLQTPRDELVPPDQFLEPEP